ncbi:MAG: nuclear transport factor 2 family protein [Gammaproteobacteria bacterium]
MTVEERNIEALKNFYATFLRGDLQALRALVSDDFVLSNDFTARVPTAGVFRGKDGLERFFSILGDAISEVHVFQADEYVASADRVAAIGHERMRVKDTGRLVDAKWVQVCRFRDGLMTNFDEYSDTAAWDVGFTPP